MANNIDIVALPTLGPDGYIFSSNQQADYLMAYFLASDYSQSNAHIGNVSSFGWLVAKYNNDITTLMGEVEKTLSVYLGRYFNNVKVTCRDATDPDSPNRNILAISAEYVLADGTTGDISRLMEINGSKFKLLSQIATTDNS